MRSGFALPLFLAAFVLGAQPGQVILLRHAEKPADPADVHLSPRGEKRAGALVSLLGNASPHTTNRPVAALYATRLTKTDRSYRTGETLAPLSQTLGAHVNTLYGSDDYAALARSVLLDRRYQGKTVVICWTHHNLAELAGAFGVRPKPPAWKDKVFDRLWLIRFENGRATLTDLPQHLLPGDSRR
jgi:hypothetical protein